MNFKIHFVDEGRLTGLPGETYNKIMSEVRTTENLEVKNRAGIFYKACNV